MHAMPTLLILLSLGAVTDIDGTQHTVEGGSIIAMTSTSCPLSRKFAPVLARLSRTRTVVFVDVDGTDSAEGFRAFAKEHGFRGVLVHDPQRRIARTLGATSTTEVFLLDGDKRVLYRGAVSDQYEIGVARAKPRHEWLADALAALDAGRAPKVTRTPAPGCVIAKGEPAKTDDTWHGRIQRNRQRPLRALPPPRRPRPVRAGDVRAGRRASGHARPRGAPEDHAALVRGGGAPAAA